MVKWVSKETDIVTRARRPRLEVIKRVVERMFAEIGALCHGRAFLVSMYASRGWGGSRRAL